MKGEVRRYESLQIRAREVVESREGKNEAPREVHGCAPCDLVRDARDRHAIQRLVRREVRKSVVQNEPGLSEVEWVQDQRGPSGSNQVLEEAVPLEDYFVCVHLEPKLASKYIIAEHVSASASVALVKSEYSLSVETLHTLPVRLVDRSSVWLVQSCTHTQSTIDSDALTNLP